MGWVMVTGRKMGVVVGVRVLAPVTKGTTVLLMVRVTKAIPVPLLAW